MSARSQLAAHLSNVLDPKRYAVVEAETMPDKISKATIVVRFRDYTDVNSLAYLLANFTVTLATPKSDPRAAEDDLDALLPDVRNALRGMRSARVPAIRKVRVKDLYSGLDFEFNKPVKITEL